MDARTSDVREFDDTPEIRQFLRGETPANGTGEPPAGRTPTFLVQRVAANGTVLETMAVYGNETIRVTRGDTVDETNATAA